MDNRKISVCIPTYCRYQMTVAAIEQVLDDNRVSEIVIVDDHSIDGAYGDLQKHYEGNDKVKVYGNFINLDCYKNKYRAMEVATGEWCILFDSDNILTKEYIDILYSIPEWSNDTIYQPVFARPHFDIRMHSGLILDKNNVKYYLHSMVETLLNAMNFFINREQYLRVWDGSIDPVTSDSIYFNYCWLKAGNKIYLTPGLEYDHLVHNGHYRQNVHKTGNFHNIVLNKLKEL